ncbi:putative pectinesterase/pectinesterase inhibitor 24 [Trifolium pratense]|uniref:putative pectinesterase/pectinesterase inhibitor 24 n=1 Tax=Trifolium pratense TaxID=57577 RepID=UPI001E695CF7|nr:putative pectinesterase/pectinesterase inhibitor 24 [Trifolium pratense]
MSSFKAYGKVDESEHVLFEVRRKSRKRITIISLSTILLVGIVFAAVFGTIAHNNAHNDGNNDDNNDQSLSSSVKAICDVTLYKDSCESSLSPLVHSGQIRPEELFKLSIQVALNAVSEGVQYFSEHGTFDELNLNVDNRTKEALMNCKDLLDLAIDHLNNSLSYGGKSSLLDVLEDLETWLSASGTYQQTCIDGLEEAEELLKSSITTNLKNSTELTSNSLAIITWLNKAANSVNFRRLLSLSHQNEEQPNWLHHKDRKLLQKDTDLKKKADIVVAKDGSGKYKTISAALKHVPDKSDKRTVIYVKKGTYYENVRVEKTKWNVMIIGDGMNVTSVSGSLNFVDGTPTFSTATFAVFGKNFIARDIGFKNTAGPQKHQAVALMTSADQAVYYKCSIDAYQDTLYAHSNRQFYRECNIYGTVDFIFGNSATVIQNCNILPKQPMQGQQNTITAQGKTDPNMNTGISIQNCNVSPFGNLSSVKTYLGRPWKNYSTTVFMQSTLGDFISPNGWLPWVGDSAPDTIFYAEFQNVGKGSSTKNRVKWKGLKNITSKEAKKFTVKAFLSGDRWIPTSGATFKSSL